jgi:arginyl-tRNA synthetase
VTTLKDTLRNLLEDALRAAHAAGELQTATIPEAMVVERPKDDAHGHLACNIAMVLARPERRAPRQIAAVLAARLRSAESLIESVEIAGPGFLNFFFRAAAQHAVLGEIEVAGDAFGRLPANGKRVNIEFISANPTGPLHIGHARGAFTGDAVARLLEAAGYEVTREYYVNDAGRQVDTLARSTLIRYQQALGREVALPEDHYPADYVRPIARIATERFGAQYADQDPAQDGAWLPLFRDLAVAENLASIRADLAQVNVCFDVWQSERALVGSGAVEDALEALRGRGDTLYASEGKLWFRSTDYGDDKDRVVIRASGDGTYFASDIAYHKAKLDRGFDRLIDVWGADHGGYVKRVEAALAALGLPSERFEALLVQMVNLVKDGKAFKIGKRSGNLILLSELVDAVGADVCRYLFLNRRSDAQYDFDIGLATKNTLENPVFYVQYGHARLCSILRRGETEGLRPCAADAAAVAGLTSADERDLLQRIAVFPEVLAGAAKALEPHRVATYLHELVAAFHSYYSRNRVSARVLDSDAPALSSARLLLCASLATVIRSGLAVLGVSAPERMVSPSEEEGA